jgi:hypothetical protein
MPTHVVLLGWYAPEQRRIDFVRQLRTHTGASLPEALDVLNGSLELDRLPIVAATLGDQAQASSLCLALLGSGCEARVVADQELEAILPSLRVELRATIARAAPGRWSLAEPMHQIGIHLLPQMNRVEQALMMILRGELPADATARFPETLTDGELGDCFSLLVAALGDEPHLHEFSWGVLHALESLRAEEYAQRLYHAYDRGDRPRGSWRHVVPYRALRDPACATCLVRLAAADTLSGTPGFIQAVRELAAGKLGSQGEAVASGFLMQITHAVSSD